MDLSQLYSVYGRQQMTSQVADGETNGWEVDSEADTQKDGGMTLMPPGNLLHRKVMLKTGCREKQY